MKEMNVATEGNIRGLHADDNAEITHFIAVLRKLQFQFPRQAVAKNGMIPCMHANSPPGMSTATG